MIAVAIASLVLISSGEPTLARAFTDLPFPFLMSKEALVQQSEWEKLAAERDQLGKEQKFVEALPLAQRVVEILRKEKPASVELGKALTTVGVLYLSLRRLDDADHQLDEARSLLERVAESGSLPISEVLTQQGYVAYEKQNLPLAQQKWEAALAIQEKIAPGSLDVARRLHNLGVLAHNRRDLDLARRRCEAALLIFDKLAPGSLDEARSLSRLASIAYDLRDLELARRRYEAALAIREKLVPGSLSVADNLNDLGDLAQERGELTEAERRYEAALAIREKVAPGSLGVAVTLGNLGNLASDRENLSEAQRLYESALAIQEKIAPGSLDVAASLSNLGHLASDRGNFSEAQRLYEGALAIREKLAPSSLAVAESLYNLGLLAFKCGDLEETQRRHEAALAIREKLAPGSLDVAESLNCLGNVAWKRGNLEGAERLHGAALAIREKLSPGSLDVALSLINLGIVAHDRSDLDSAQRRYEAALAIQERLAPGSLDVASSLTNLGTVAHGRGDLDLAQRLHEAARSIFQKRAPGSLDMAYSLSNLGAVAFDQGNFDGAQRLYQAALLIRAKLAPGSPDMAKSLGYLGDAMDRGSRFDEAQRAFGQQIQVLGMQVESAFGVADAGISRLAETMSAQTITNVPARYLPSLYDGVLHNRYLQTRTGLTSQIQELVARDPDLQALRLKALETRKVADDLALDPEVEAAKTEAAARAASSASLEFLSQLKKKHGAALRLIPPTRIELQAKLGSDGAIVDFYRRTDRAKPYYLAVVTLGTGKPHFIEVGSEEEIEAAVRKLQELMNGRKGSAEAEANEMFAKLDELTFRKLDTVLKGKTRVYVVADGVIAQIPLAGLVTGVKADKSSETGKRTSYRIEDMALRLVPSPLEPGLRPTGASGEGSVIVADIDPNLDPSAAKVKPNRAQFATTSKPGETKGDGLDENGNWTILNYAEQEIKKLKATETLRYAQVWRKDMATEEQLLKLKSPRYLIISAHGFFTEKNDPEGSFKKSAMMSQLAKADDSMFRSGLVLSGANHAEELRKQGKYDGLLTAADAARLNLRGTRLVVLSACQSGRGDFSAGMGVLGLRRAFRTAGAQGVVMSLFNVPNQSTAELMALFFKNVKEGSDNAEALRKAQLEMMRDKGPFHWAGFVYEGS